MPQSSYIVSGKVYTSRGTIANSNVLINSEKRVITDSSGNYIFDMANLSDGYTDGETYTIEAWDELDNETVSDSITISGESQTKHIYLEMRDKTNQKGGYSGTINPARLVSIGDKPITSENPLQIYNLERPLTQKIAYSGTNPEYIGEAAPGTPSSAAKWRIKKLVYNATPAVTDALWCQGNAEFDKVWDDRAGYQYA